MPSCSTRPSASSDLDLQATLTLLLKQIADLKQVTRLQAAE